MRPRSSSRSGVKVYELIQPSRAVVVVDLAPAPVLDLPPAPTSGSRAVEILGDYVHGRAEDKTDPHRDVEGAQLIGDRLGARDRGADEKEAPQRVRQERPFRGTNDASFAQAPHSTSSSFVTQPLRTARRSSSRRVVSS